MIIVSKATKRHCAALYSHKVEG